MLNHWGNIYDLTNVVKADCDIYMCTVTSSTAVGLEGEENIFFVTNIKPYFSMRKHWNKNQYFRVSYKCTIYF